MHMESILNLDLEMYPDIVEMLDGVAPGDEVEIKACFQVKVLTDKRFTGSFEDKYGVSITEKGEKDYEDEGSEGEEGSAEEDTEEESG